MADPTWSGGRLVRTGCGTRTTCPVRFAVRFRYAYSARGQKLYKYNGVNPDYSELYHSNGVTAGQVGDGEAGQFGYDPLGRMTAFYVGELGGTGSTRFHEVADDAREYYTTWGYNARNEWTFVDSNGTPHCLNDAVGTFFQAVDDALGTTTAAVAANLGFTREGNRYDAWHRLIESHREASNAKGGSPTWSAAPVYEAFGSNDYEYDALGWLIRSGVQTLYYSAAWQPIVVAEPDWGTWQAVAENVWSLAYVDAMLFQDRAYAGAMQRIYPLHDASYDVTSLVKLADGVWQVTQRHLYEPYGKVWAVLDGLWQPLAKASQTRWHYLHKGGYYTADCLYHFRKRSYDPSRGQWMQRDPAGYLDSLNLHEYLGSSPVNAVDPQGEFVILGITITASLVAGYLAKTAVVSAAETTIEYGIARLQGREYNWGVGFAKNMAVNTVVGLIPGGAIAKTAKKGSRLAKLLKAGVYTTKLALRTTGDAAFDTWQYGGSFRENMLYSGLGNVGGDVIGMGLGYAGRQWARRAARRQQMILRAARRTARSVGEAKGIRHGFQRMWRQGYKALDVDLHYGSNHGIDAAFRKKSWLPWRRHFAVLEAKAGYGGGQLSGLRVDTRGLRQGSRGYNIDRLLKFVDSSPARGENIARVLLQRARSGELLSFASFAKNRRLYRLPNGWPGSASPVLI